MSLSVILIYILPVLVSFLASWYVFIPVLRMAKLKQLFDLPNDHQLQPSQVPVMGGLVVFFGIICGILLASCFVSLTGFVPLFAAMTILLIVGMLDDMLNVSPFKRFILELIVVLCLIFGSGQCIDHLQGLFGITTLSWTWAVPFTLIACVGIINAINMIDGVNGLSSGLCITCGLFFALHFIHMGNVPSALLNLLMVASLIPFWIHNVLGRTSRMFIGDAGTMVMGTLLSWNVIQLFSSPIPHPSPFTLHPSPLPTLSLLALPVFDTLRVMIQRICSGTSPFRADRNHLHHILFAYSQSHSLTAAAEVLITLIIYTVAQTTAYLQFTVNQQFTVIVLLAALLVWGTYVLLFYNNQHNTGFAFRTRKFLATLRQGHRHWWLTLQTWVDRGA